jgi:molecular chaperone GrpE
MSAETTTPKGKKSEQKPTTPKKGPAKPKVSKDKQKIKELSDQLAQLEDKHLRLKAEFENFRRRKEREVSRLLEYEGEAIFKDLLPIVDDLERLVAASNHQEKPIDDAIKQGMEMILSKVNKFLRNWQIEAFGQAGETLDAEIHDALMVKSVDGKADDEILEVFEKGYRYKDHVIRHAKVIVNKS